MRRIAFLALILAVVVPLAPHASASRQQRVVGGRDATRPYPAMAEFLFNGNHSCGGTLVRPQWVLTAKHCTAGRNPAQITIMLGSQVRSAPGQIHQVTQVIADPAGASDSAVLKLATPSSIAPARIGMPAEAAQWAPGTKAIATGWGSDAFLVGSSPDRLQEVEVPIVSDADCATLNGPTVGMNPAYEICAGEQTGGKDTCQGDSGGPLWVHDADGRLIVIGSTWKGLGCGYPLFYGAYASVGEGPINAWLNSVLPPESSLSAEDASAAEGGSGGGNVARITIRRLGTTTKTVEVDFATADGSATAGEDYWGVAGTLVFDPADRTQTITVPLLQDGIAEGDETFTLELSSPVDAEISVATATVTLADDD